MTSRIGNKQWVILVTSIICVSGVRGQDDSCGVDTKLCGIRTRLEGFIPSNCSHPCNFLSAFGRCQLDATCYFRTVVSLIEPAGYEHLLHLTNVETVHDAVTSVESVNASVSKEIQAFDELVEVVADTYRQFFDDELLGYKRIVSANESDISSTCSQFCTYFDDYGSGCGVNVTCYFEYKFQQWKPLRNSHLLNVSGYHASTDVDTLVEGLIGQIQSEKRKIETFGRYVIYIFDVMVDIASEQGYSLMRYGCRPSLGGFGGGFGGAGFVAGLRAHCSGTCMKTSSTGDCVLDLKCFRSRFSYS